LPRRYLIEIASPAIDTVSAIIVTLNTKATRPCAAYLRAGLTWYSEDDVTVAASFSGAPGSVAPFTIVANTDEIQADIAAGIEMISGEDSNLRLFYVGQFGDRLAVHAAGFKASVKF